MYCSACGKQQPEDTRFCRECGAALGPPVVPAAPSTPSQPQWSPGAMSGGAGGYGAPGPGPGGPRQTGGGKRWGMWIAIAALAVVIIAVAVTVPLVLARNGEEEVTETTTTSPATTGSTSTTEATTTSETTTRSSSTSTSTTVVAGPSGDSAGEWVEMTIPDAPSQVFSVAVSNDALLIQAPSGSGYTLYAHSFLSGTTVELPVGSNDVGGIDLDKNTAVWWEGTYDDATGSYVDQHIYSYAIPEGPKVEVAGGDANVGYPQIAGIWETWVVGSPWEVNPEEYWRMPIFGSFVPVSPGSANEPQELVPSAIAPILGDASWTYSLGETFLAWEQGAAVDNFGVGSYVLDLMNPGIEPLSLGGNAWRPSISLDNVVYWDEGLKLLNLTSGETIDVDPRGDFPTAAPTYVAYFRSVETGDANPYEIVARGLTGAHEQVLGRQADPPWLSSAVAASGQYVAFVAGEVMHVFEWRGR